jgi:hypothetical protein
MSLTRSLIPQQHRPILDQLPVRLSLRQGQVSTMSQWWMSRSRSALVILASPKAESHSLGAILEVRAFVLAETPLANPEPHIAAENGEYE